MPLPRLDGVARFAARLALAAAVAAVAWWIVHAPFGAGFRALGNLLFGSFAQVEFLLAPGNAFSTADTLVQLGAGAGATVRRFQLGSFRSAYVPLVTVVALSFAAGPWKAGRRREVALALAGAAAYVLFALTVTLGHAALWGPSAGPLALAVELAYRTLVNPPAFEYVAPGFIWFACGGGVVQACGVASPTRAPKVRPVRPERDVPRQSLR